MCTYINGFAGHAKHMYVVRSYCNFGLLLGYLNTRPPTKGATASLRLVAKAGNRLAACTGIDVFEKIITANSSPDLSTPPTPRTD